MRDDRNLDVLRAVAVLLVLVTHVINAAVAPANLERVLAILGNDGVIIFFVHTSLVLMRSLERSGGNAGHFYIRRIFRIYPLAILTVAVVVAFHLRREPLDLTYIPPTTSELIGNLSLTMNLLGVRSLSAPMWSLPYEMEMYVLLPLLFIVIRRAHGRRGLLVLAVASVVIAGLYLVLVPHLRGLGRLSVLYYLPCFGAGIIAYRACQMLTPRIPAWMWVPLLLTVVAGSTLLDVNEYVRGWIVAGIVGFAIPFVRELPSSPGTRFAHYVAKYSYGIYLSHIPILVVAVNTQGPLWVRVAATAFALVTVPVFLYHAIEYPMVKLGATVAGYRMRPRQNLAPAP